MGCKKRCWPSQENPWKRWWSWTMKKHFPDFTVAWITLLHLCHWSWMRTLMPSLILMPQSELLQFHYVELPHWKGGKAGEGERERQRYFNFHSTAFLLLLLPSNLYPAPCEAPFSFFVLHNVKRHKIVLILMPCLCCHFFELSYGQIPENVSPLHGRRLNSPARSPPHPSLEPRMTP